MRNNIYADQGVITSNVWKISKTLNKQETGRRQSTEDIKTVNKHGIGRKHQTCTAFTWQDFVSFIRLSSKMERLELGNSLIQVWSSTSFFNPKV